MSVISNTCVTCFCRTVVFIVTLLTFDLVKERKRRWGKIYVGSKCKVSFSLSIIDAQTERLLLFSPPSFFINHSLPPLLSLFPPFIHLVSWSSVFFLFFFSAFLNDEVLQSLVNPFIFSCFPILHPSTTSLFFPSSAFSRSYLSILLSFLPIFLSFLPVLPCPLPVPSSTSPVCETQIFSMLLFRFLQDLSNLSHVCSFCSFWTATLFSVFFFFFFVLM